MSETLVRAQRRRRGARRRDARRPSIFGASPRPVRRASGSAATTRSHGPGRLGIRARRAPPSARPRWWCRHGRRSDWKEKRDAAGCARPNERRPGRTPRTTKRGLRRNFPVRAGVPGGRPRDRDRDRRGRDSMVCDAALRRCRDTRGPARGGESVRAVVRTTPPAPIAALFLRPPAGRPNARAAVAERPSHDAPARRDVARARGAPPPPRRSPRWRARERGERAR